MRMISIPDTKEGSPKSFHLKITKQKYLGVMQ